MAHKSWELLPGVDEHPNIYVDVRGCLDSMPCSHRVKDDHGVESFMMSPYIRKLYEDRSLPIPKHFVLGAPGTRFVLVPKRQEKTHADPVFDGEALSVTKVSVVKSHASKRKKMPRTSQQSQPNQSSGRSDTASWRRAELNL